jgi:hypothetical protein
VEAPYLMGIGNFSQAICSEISSHGKANKAEEEKVEILLEF